MIFRFCKELGLVEISISLFLFITFSLVVYNKFDAIKCQSLKSEAKFGLKEIFNAQMLYLSEKGQYASLNELKKYRVVLKQDYYEFYHEKKPEQSFFKIKAKGKPGTLVEGDIWSIDEKDQLINEIKICKK